MNDVYICEHVIDTVPGPIESDGKGGEKRKVKVIVCGDKNNKFYEIQYFSQDEFGYLSLCEHHAVALSKTLGVEEVSEEEFLASCLLNI